MFMPLGVCLFQGSGYLDSMFLHVG
jgi:hypothetical protein